MLRFVNVFLSEEFLKKMCRQKKRISRLYGVHKGKQKYNHSYSGYSFTGGAVFFRTDEGSKLFPVYGGGTSSEAFALALTEEFRRRSHAK